MIGRIRRLVAAALLLASPAAVLAGQSVVTSGPITFRVTVSAEQAFVAQPLEFVLQVDAPRGAIVKLPQISGMLGTFEIRDFQTTADIPIAGTSERRRWIGRGSVESLRAGDFSIPSLEAQIRMCPDTSAPKTLRSEPVSVRILSSVEDRAEATAFRDIKDVVDVSVPREPHRGWRWYIGGGIAALVLFGIAGVYVVRRRQEVSPVQWALREIDQVEQAFRLERSNAIECYEQLADVLAEYLRLRFAPDVALRWIDEKADAHDPRLPNLKAETQSEIHELLSAAEQVKFACLTISRPDLLRTMQQVRHLVEECERVTGIARTEPT